MKRYLLFLLLTFPVAASAQLGIPLAPDVGDSRSSAMGRTSIASPSGSNTLFTNPAGLGTLREMQAAAGGRLFFGTVNEEYTDDEGTESYESRYEPHLKIAPLSFAMPYALADTDVKLAFGLGYQTYFDFSRRFSAEIDDDELTGESSGGLTTLSPAVAIAYEDRFFAGISYNKSVMGTITEEFEFDGEDQGEVEVETSGAFWMLGGLARITPKLTVGFNYRAAFEWEWEVKEGFASDILPGNPGNDFDLAFPAIYGVGGAFEASNSLLLVGEYQNRPFSDYEVMGRRLLDIDDGYSLRLGAEISGDVPFRFGLFKDAIFDTDGNDDDPLSLYGVTAGLGFQISDVEIDAAAEFGRWGAEINENAFSAEYDETLFNVRVTARYRFDRSDASATTAAVTHPLGDANGTDTNRSDEGQQELTENETDNTSSTNEKEEHRRLDGGVGFGVPYGILGGNTEYMITQNVYASLGLGTTIFAGMGWSVGARYAFGPDEKPFRPRVGAYFGTNAMVAEGILGDGTTFTGLTVGGGFKWMWGSSKRWGLDADVLYIATSEFDPEVYRARGYDVVGGDVKFSLGLRYSL